MNKLTYLFQKGKEENNRPLDASEVAPARNDEKSSYGISIELESDLPIDEFRLRDIRELYCESNYASSRIFFNPETMEGKSSVTVFQIILRLTP